MYVSFRDIAEALGEPESTVRRKVALARKRGVEIDERRQGRRVLVRLEDLRDVYLDKFDELLAKLSGRAKAEGGLAQQPQASTSAPTPATAEREGASVEELRARIRELEAENLELRRALEEVAGEGVDVAEEFDDGLRIVKKVRFKPSILLYYEAMKRLGYERSFDDFVNDVMLGLLEEVMRFKLELKGPIHAFTARRRQ